MKKIILVLSVFFVTSCVSSYRESLGQYNLPTTNIREASKEGRACYYSGGLKFWNSDVDFTVDSARRNAGITNITAIEKETVGNVLLRKKCIIVRGS